MCFDILMKKPGARVLYLGAASGTTVSHVSDIVGPVSSYYEKCGLFACLFTGKCCLKLKIVVF